MEKLRIILACMVLLAGLSAEIHAEDNPFDKGVDVNIGRDQAWLIKDKTATRSGADSGNFYHFSYDRKQLRLRITSGAEDSEATARQYQQFAVEDMQIDGQQLPLFQWCLANQARHSRFLQQGLKVKQDVCSNIGEQGTFIMKLNAATLDALEKGRTLSIKIKPFRSSINLNFDISDFSETAARLEDKVVVVQKAPAPVAAPVVVEKKVMAPKTCKAAAPKEFAKIKPVEYRCDDAAAKTAAEASIAAVVTKERELAAKLAAENERKQKAAAEAKKAKELADKKLQAEQLAIEQAKLAETEAAKQEINNEITNKMLAVCMRKWEKGESRCYCEKFLEHAPAGIVADPACAATASE